MEAVTTHGMFLLVLVRAAIGSAMEADSHGGAADAPLDLGILDEELCLAAVHTTPTALRYVPPSLHSAAVCMAAVIGHGSALVHVCKGILMRSGVGGGGVDYVGRDRPTTRHLITVMCCRRSTPHCERMRYASRPFGQPARRSSMCRWNFAMSPCASALSRTMDAPSVSCLMASSHPTFAA